MDLRSSEDRLFFTDISGKELGQHGPSLWGRNGFYFWVTLSPTGKAKGGSSPSFWTDNHSNIVRASVLGGA